MAPVKVFLASVFCAALVCASVGATRDLQATTTCSVRAYAAAWSFNQAVCKSAYTEGSKVVWTEFCKNPTDLVPARIDQIVEKDVTTVVTAIAKAAAGVSFYATISPSCEVGSYAYFSAAARAKAVAKAVAASFASAWSVVIGPDAWTDLGAAVYAEASALAVTCEKQYAQILGAYHLCEKVSCNPTTCDVKCYYWDADCETATAKAIAEAYVRVEALVEFYFKSDQCADPCEMAMCSYVCPEGC